MNNPRIVSLLPAATEMVYALGLGDSLVGVSHECDFPAAAKTKPVVVRPALDLDKMSLREIDVAVAERRRSGQSLYEADEELLRQLEPDLILTQDLCQVCASSGEELATVLPSLKSKPEVLWLNPHSIEDIFQNVRDVGLAAKRSRESESLIAEWRTRLEKIADRTRSVARRPRALFMEWADPVYCAGHWTPEMIELAGGFDALARRGANSVRVAWNEVLQWAPEIMILAPCGFSLEQAREQLRLLESSPGWQDIPAVRAGRVHAVDANAFFARPGPRVVEGVELLARLIHPDAQPV